MTHSITDIHGIRVGHAHDLDALTGCTVVLCPEGTVGGVDVRGGAPGTRETDLLDPVRLVDTVHAVLLAGGSAFGLDAAAGVMRWLEEREIGVETRAGRVPIVPAAILYDLAAGRADIRPDAAMGYAACENASDDPPAEGRVGAGTGATVGKILGMARASRGGIGTASVEIAEGLRVGALIAANAVGDVVDPKTGAILAGPQGDEEGTFLNTMELMRGMIGAGSPGTRPGENTVIGVVATNATLDKAQTNRLAQMAHDGLAQAIRPSHTMLDGDTIFALATGGHPAGSGLMDLSALGAWAAEVAAEAIQRAVA